MVPVELIRYGKTTEIVAPKCGIPPPRPLQELPEGLKLDGVGRSGRRGPLMSLTNSACASLVLVGVEDAAGQARRLALADLILLQHHQ